LVPILVQDPRETALPNTGVICLEDEESGKTIYLNTTAKETREKFRNIKLAKKLAQERLFKSLGIEPINISLAKPYFAPLTKYFKKRAKKY
jgi:hypothetical protein